MRLLPVLVVSMVTAACCALVAGAGAAAGATSAAAGLAAAAATGGTWGAAQEVPGSAALNTGGSAVVNSVSCASAGTCAAGGYYEDVSGQFQPFVADETGGSWGKAQEVPGSAALNTGGSAAVRSVSCASAGNCAAGGFYMGKFEYEQAFVSDETAGTWGTAQEVPGLAALDAGGASILNSVSCASAGNCAAGGFYTDASGHEQAFVADETSGSWGTAQEVPGSAMLNAGGAAIVNSVSCASAGNCAAGGQYRDSSGGYQAFVADETGGSWGRAREVPGSAILNAGGAATVNSVSCASAGNCAAGGSYTDAANHEQAFVADEAGGTWGTAQEVGGAQKSSATPPLNAGGRATVSSVSCASAGNCAAGGSYTDAANHVQAFVVDEASGTWGTAQEVPGSATLNAGGGALVTSVSCAAPGSCADGGFYTDSSGHEQAFTAEEARGTWGPAQEVPGSATLNAGGNAFVNSVSCASPGSCAAGGFYTDSSDSAQAFVAEVSATSTSIVLSAPTVSYGDEQAEQVSVTVSSQSGQTPAGSVTITAGSVTVCTITVPGSGSCTLTATQFPPSSTQLTAAYSGGTGFTASTSPGQPLTVSRAPTTTSLALSAPATPYGDEQAEHLLVAVSSSSGLTPTGTVTITAGSATVCTITLSSGSGTCELRATTLPAGLYQVTASYAGTTDVAASASTAELLSVSQVTSTTSLSLSQATITYGDEQAEQVSVTVSPQYSGTPHGKVTVKSGAATVCTITLASGSGTCRPAATQFPPGSTQFTATYDGGTDFAASTSAAQTLTVAKAASKTTLSLSTAKVTYGEEQAERMTVTVTTQYNGTPAGKVTIKAGTTTVCTITLASGKGSCRLTPRQLRVGSHTLAATYRGNSDLTRSASAKKTLHVAK